MKRKIWESTKKFGNDENGGFFKGFLHGEKIGDFGKNSGWAIFREGSIQKMRSGETSSGRNSCRKGEWGLEGRKSYGRVWRSEDRKKEGGFF